MAKFDMIRRDADMIRRGAASHLGRVQMLQTVRVIVAACVLSFVVACASKPPVLNIDNVPIATTHTPEQVRQAIITAGASKGWIMQEVKPGVLHGTLRAHAHQADIDVAYSAKTYSIDYVSSVNLDYKNGTIHRNYNKWITSLNEAIQVQLSR
jgi:hypothetical protein